VGVDAQSDLTAKLANDVERGQRHEDLIANAADVDNDPVWLLLEDPAAQVRNHKVLSFWSWSFVFDWPFVPGYEVSSRK
jgi:hypothetical protein